MIICIAAVILKNTLTDFSNKLYKKTIIIKDYVENPKDPTVWLNGARSPPKYQNVLLEEWKKMNISQKIFSCFSKFVTNKSVF
jgi:hypothetical protein